MLFLFILPMHCALVGVATWGDSDWIGEFLESSRVWPGMLSSLVLLECFDGEIAYESFDVILSGIKNVSLFLEDGVVVVVAKGNKDSSKIIYQGIYIHPICICRQRYV